MSHPIPQAAPPPDSAEPGGGPAARTRPEDSVGSGPRHRPVTGPRRLSGVLLTVAVILPMLAVVLWAARPSPGRPAAARPASASEPTDAADILSRQIDALQRRLKATPSDYTSWATLGIDYIQKAKDTVDPAYYPKAAGVLQRSLRLNSTDNFVAMVGMADLRAAEHQFADALSWARRANRIDPYNSTVYGALNDAYTQLGRYDDAAQAAQKMVDLEPGTPSLARAEYVFELRGQVDLARTAMQRALEDASSPAQQAFAHYYLGELAFTQGDAAQALIEQNAGLRADPAYPDLLAGKAKAEAALGQEQAALRDYAALVARVPQPQYLIEAGEYLQSLGLTERAQQYYDLFATEAKLFTGNGVQLDVEPTLFYADHGDPALAMTYGRSGIRMRPFLEMDDAYAWALHANHRETEALVWANKAMSTGMRNALFAYHRGMIERSLGDPAAARHDLSQALALNPAFNPLQAPVARRALTELGGPE
jgi:tetratricopeptide (TPR) repeat protein